MTTLIPEDETVYDKPTNIEQSKELAATRNDDQQALICETTGCFKPQSQPGIHDLCKECIKPVKQDLLDSSSSLLIGEMDSSVMTIEQAKEEGKYPMAYPQEGDIWKNQLYDLHVVKIQGDKVAYWWEECLVLKSSAVPIKLFLADTTIIERNGEKITPVRVFEDGCFYPVRFTDDHVEKGIQSFKTMARYWHFNDMNDDVRGFYICGSDTTYIEADFEFIGEKLEIGFHHE